MPIQFTTDGSPGYRRLALWQDIVCDVFVGARRGPQIVAQLREHEPSLPVVYTSGHTRAAIELQYGPLDERSDFVSKPFSGDVLVGCVAELLGAPART